jgi:hypothetical protein
MDLLSFDGRRAVDGGGAAGLGLWRFGDVQRHEGAYR